MAIPLLAASLLTFSPSLSPIARRTVLAAALSTASAASAIPASADVELPAEAAFLVPTPLGLISYGLDKQAQKQKQCYDAGECVDEVPYYQLECQRGDDACLARRRREGSKAVSAFASDPLSSPLLLVLSLFFFGGPLAAIIRTTVGLIKPLLPEEEPATPQAGIVDAPSIITRCALQRDAPAAEVIAALEAIEAAPADDGPNLSGRACATDLSGQQTWELVFSSAAAKLPLLDGYMPNEERLTWDLEAQRLELEIETLPLAFVPKIRIVGEGLRWDEAAQTLTYTVGSKPPSEWRVLWLDRANGVLAARSSVTGLNVIRRLEQKEA